MFVKNAWYCACWDHEVTQSQNSLIEKKIAGERVVLYRKQSGQVVALEDRCPHRQAPLSLGKKEGDSIRCMYHGIKFDDAGQCIEVPGQDTIPPRACVRAFPVVEKNNWIWVWMGDPEKADPDLICHSVGPSHPDYNIKASYVRINSDYRLEIANLADLTHSSFVHEDTFAMGWAQVHSKPEPQLLERGIKTVIWCRSAPVPKFVSHMFPEGFLCDAHFSVTQTIPCNWILHFRVFSAGTATEGESDGQLLLDSWSCQAITPRDEDSVDYYYSWGASKATDRPGFSDMLREGIDDAFAEDKAILEGQHKRMKEKPDHQQMSIAADAGPTRILSVLKKMLKAEEESAGHTAD